MTDDMQSWVKTHQKQALAGGGVVLVAVIALIAKKRTAAAAAATPASTQAALDAQTAADVAAGTIAQPGTTLTDVQNAVQDQVNQDLAGFRTEFGQEVSTQLAGVTLTTGVGTPTTTTAAGKPVATVPTAAQIAANNTKHIASEYSVNENQLAHHLAPVTDAQYKASHPGGALESTAQRSNITVHTPKPPPPAPRPKVTVAPKPQKVPVRK